MFSAGLASLTSSFQLHPLPSNFAPATTAPPTPPRAPKNLHPATPPAHDAIPNAFPPAPLAAAPPPNPPHVERWHDLDGISTVSGYDGSTYKHALYSGKHIIRRIVEGATSKTGEVVHEVLCCYCDTKWGPYSPRYYDSRAQVYHMKKDHADTEVGRVMGEKVGGMEMKRKEKPRVPRRVKKEKVEVVEEGGEGELVLAPVIAAKVKKRRGRPPRVPAKRVKLEKVETAVRAADEAAEKARNDKLVQEQLYQAKAKRNLEILAAAVRPFVDQGIGLLTPEMRHRYRTPTVSPLTDREPPSAGQRETPLYLRRGYTLPMNAAESREIPNASAVGLNTPPANFQEYQLQRLEPLQLQIQNTPNSRAPTDYNTPREIPHEYRRTISDLDDVLYQEIVNIKFERNDSGEVIGLSEFQRILEGPAPPTQIIHQDNHNANAVPLTPITVPEAVARMQDLLDRALPQFVVTDLKTNCMMLAASLALHLKPEDIEKAMEGMLGALRPYLEMRRLEVEGFVRVSGGGGMRS